MRAVAANINPFGGGGQPKVSETDEEDDDSDDFKDAIDAGDEEANEIFDTDNKFQEE